MDLPGSLMFEVALRDRWRTYLRAANTMNTMLLRWLLGSFFFPCCSSPLSTLSRTGLIGTFFPTRVYVLCKCANFNRLRSLLSAFPNPKVYSYSMTFYTCTVDCDWLQLQFQLHQPLHVIVLSIRVTVGFRLCRPDVVP